MARKLGRYETPDGFLRCPVDSCGCEYERRWFLATHLEMDHKLSAARVQELVDLVMSDYGTAKRWEVLTYSLCGGWENCWTVSDANGNETKQTFATRKEAQKEIDEFLNDRKEMDREGFNLESEKAQLKIEEVK